MQLQATRQPVRIMPALDVFATIQFSRLLRRRNSELRIITLYLRNSTWTRNWIGVMLNDCEPIMMDCAEDVGEPAARAHPKRTPRRLLMKTTPSTFAVLFGSRGFFPSSLIAAAGPRFRITSSGMDIAC